MYPSCKKGELWQIEFGFMCRMYDGAIWVVDGDRMHSRTYVADG